MRVEWKDVVCIDADTGKTKKRTRTEEIIGVYGTGRANCYVAIMCDQTQRIHTRQFREVRQGGYPDLQDKEV